MYHHSSPLAVCGPSLSTYVSSSCPWNLMVELKPGDARTFSPLRPTPTTFTVLPMAKSPGGSDAVGGIVGSGAVGVIVTGIGIAVGLAGGPAVNVEVMTTTIGVSPPATWLLPMLLTTSSAPTAA